MTEATVHLYLLGQTRATLVSDGVHQDLHVQPKPLHLLAYLALQQERGHRREELQALFWPDKAPRSAANNLRQALWHLRRALPAPALQLMGDLVGWNPAFLPWVDALVFEAALDARDFDGALERYTGPLLPDLYDEWAQLERERLQLRYLEALESRAQRHYTARFWQAALVDTQALLSVDPLNEAAIRLTMACHWGLNQREAARRSYDVHRERLGRELGIEPLPETSALYQRILRGEAHPNQDPPPADAATAAESAHLSLLETLGAFHRGLEQAIAWASKASGEARVLALRWQGRFFLRLGQLDAARTVLTDALGLASGRHSAARMGGRSKAFPLADTSDLEALVLTDLATVETGLADYPSAETHYNQALRLSPLQKTTRQRLLSGLGGLQGRMGRGGDARLPLQKAVQHARDLGDPAPLAIASGNLGILLIAQGEREAAAAVLDQALEAARQADAHWLTAHVTGHLGLLAQDQGDLETAAGHYRHARYLAETIGDQRCAALWTLNLGVLRYEQGQCAAALPVLTQGREQASRLGARSLEAGANIFIGACLVGQGQGAAGLATIERGLALAKKIGDQERTLIGLLHQGRALAALGRPQDARVALQQGLHQAQGSRMHRLEGYLRAELEHLSPPS